MPAGGGLRGPERAREEGATPLDSVLSYIPASHEKVARQTLYHVVAGLLILLLTAAASATYLVFQPFIKPLVWAVLLGSVLFPVKRRLTVATDRWLARQQSAATAPLFIQAVLLPLVAADAVVVALASAALRRIRRLAAAALALALLNTVHVYWPQLLLLPVWLLNDGLLAYLLWLLASIFHNKLLCWTCVVSYLLAVAFFWSSTTSRLAVPAWLLVLGFVSGLAGSLAGHIFVALVALLALGLVSEVRQFRRQNSAAGLNTTLSDTIRHVMCGCNSHSQQPQTTSSTATITCPNTTASAASSTTNSASVDTNTNTCCSQSHTTAVVTTTCDELPSAIAVSPVGVEDGGAGSSVMADTPVQSASTLTARMQRNMMTSTPVTRARPRLPQVMSADDQVGSTTDDLTAATVRAAILAAATTDTTDTTDTVTPASGESTVSATTRYITTLVYVCVVVVVWQRIWLLTALPVLVVYCLLRQLVVNFWYSGGGEAMCGALQPVFVWLHVRREGLLPLPIRGAWKLVLRGNAALIARMRESVDAVVTCVVIMAGIVFVFTAAILASLQVYAETVHMVEVGVSVLNTSAKLAASQPQLHALLPANMSAVLENVLDKGYLYGREYISSTIRGLVTESSLQEDGSGASAQLERQTLELWSRMYQASLNSVVAAPAIGPVVDADAVMGAGRLWLRRVGGSLSLLNWDSLKSAASSNVGTVLSLLDSCWSVMISNTAKLISLLTTLVSVVLGGGFAVLNTLINLIVFLTALFYLLSASGRLYRPAELLMKLAPVATNAGVTGRLVMAVNEAVSGVFVASLKMSVFYFLWTWLVHSLFAVRFVYLPSVSAAMLAAVPFLGSYWAALPAVLELWLLQQRPLAAGLFFATQIAPVLYVDAAIYSDVKGCHPYLTGLAIAGGILALGMEGAFFGPLLLCCLLVAINVYSSVLKPPPGGATVGVAPPRSRFQRYGSIC